MFAKELTAFRKPFFHKEAHSHYLCAGLPTEMDDATGRVTVRQEIIDEEDTNRQTGVQTPAQCIINSGANW